MKIRCKRKWLCFVLFFGAFLFTSDVLAQVIIGTVDPGPFTPGSTIAVPFKLPASCISQGNQFQLYLSDQNGNFATETPIGTYNSFYSTYVNGLLPTGLTPGTGYRVRVKTTLPATVSAASTPFEVKAGAPIEARLTSTILNGAVNDETFGTCASRANSPFFLKNESTANSVVTATVTDEITGTVATPISFPASIQTFTAQQSHYTIYTKAVMPDGTVATKAYLLINNKAVTTFANTGNSVLCLPLATFKFNVDVTSISGIQNNFPGDIYTITWGDLAVTTHTLCDIINNGGVVEHTYLQSSCGSVSTSSAGTIYNAFDVSIKVSNAFCPTMGTPVSSSAKVVIKPINNFEYNNPGCTNAEITFVNTSTLGENPTNNTPGCIPNNITYNWAVDGVTMEIDKPRSFNFIYKFPTHGEHTVTLSATNKTGDCDPEPTPKKICIQDPPKPAFEILPSTICAGTTLIPKDISVIDNICNAANSYSWSVTPAVGFAGGTNAASKEPQFNFTNPGTYIVTLSITTPSCGPVVSLPQTVIVNETPKAVLSPGITLCNLTTYDFNNTTTGPTKTLISGTTQELADTYTWEVIPTGSGTYSFTGGTTANSKYPSIKFDNYDTYKVSVTHKNNCGSVTDSQILTFSTAPVVNAGADQSICFNDPSFTLSGAITGATTTQTWIGGAGTFSPNNHDLNAVYTPTLAEKRAGIVTLTLRVTTALAAPCNQIDDDIILKIKPDISLTSAGTKTICTGNNVAYTPTSAVAGVTYTWTATGTTTATGYTANGAGNIIDALTNTDLNADATVTYIITPHFDGCDGTPFQLVVTVKPNPVITASPNNTICNKTSSAITLSANLTGINYTYTSTVTGSITGNSTRSIASPATQINDILTNSGTTSGTVTYSITPISLNGCPGAPINVTITVLPSVTLANAGADDAICNLSTYTLKGNNPIVGTGKWTIVSAPTTIAFTDDTQPTTDITGLQAGNTYILKWTIKDASCSTSADDVQITVNPLSVGGSTAGDVDVCAGANGGNITLTGQVGNIVRWERSIDNGITWSTIISTANPFVFSNLAISTKYRAIVQSGSCAEAISSVTTITVNPGTVAANAGPDQNLCSGNGITLNGNNPAPNTGKWEITSGPTVVITDPTLYNTTVTGLVPGQTYTFRWTISGFNGCPPSTDDVTVIYYPPVTNNINPITAPTCSGQGITITGDTPTGGTGTFAYQWQSSADGNTWINIPTATNKDLTLTLSLSTYFRRLVNSAICVPSTSNSIQVTVLPGLTNNTISADQNICTGAAIAPLIGAVPGGGSGSYTYQWQASNNGTTWTDVLGAVGPNFVPPIPTATIYYRRSVTSGACSNNLSNQVKITVNPHALAELNFVKNVDCAPFKLVADNITATLHPDRNATYTWFANGTQIGLGPIFPGYTIVNGNESVIIRLVVTSSLGCNTDEKSQEFRTLPVVTPSFTASTTEDCGPIRVTFTNTTTPIDGATYEWIFNNGSGSLLAQPPVQIFEPDANGGDKTYTVTLKTTPQCGPPVEKTVDIIVHAKPVAQFFPDKTTGCSNLLVTFKNNSPVSTGTTYTYDFGDGSEPKSYPDRRDVDYTFRTTEVKDFVVKMTAKNSCGETSAIPVVIRVSPNNIIPALIVNGNEKRGCAPWTVNFLNNTSGASRFIYTITNEDSGEAPIQLPTNSTGIFPYIFMKPGRYTIRLDAENDCSKNFATETVTILAQPTASFSADKTVGCTNLAVKFKNTSAGAIGYTWDFGDGSPVSNEFEPQHTYTGSGVNYAVKLTTVNAEGCKNSITLPNFINIVAPPVATFTVTPGNDVSIPNYSFAFKDISTDAVSWQWTFGDGAVSTLQNPNHTYANEGSYTVTLKVLNKEGCSSTTFQLVRIIGVPGNLNIPNSFMPASSKNEIKVFKAKGRGIKEWQMSVFNKWGQLLWETTKLDDGSPLEGWDGTYNGQDQPQGVYYWKVDIKFINGSDWKGMTYDSSPPKKTGVIYLIR